LKEDEVSNRKLQPEVKVFEKKIYSTIIQGIGWALFSFCVYRWVLYFFIYEYYRSLTHTTFLTLILISLTCINKFESTVLNSAVSMSFLLFIIVSVLFVPLATDLSTFIEGVVLHGAIAAFQIYVVINKKIAISKKYLLWSFLLYLIFISSYDSFTRIIAAIEVNEDTPIIKMIVQVFYVLSISTILVYFYKKKFGILLT
jgi:hypothetical protein